LAWYLLIYLRKLTWEDRRRKHPLTYSNPPSDVESDCIGEVQAPSNVEEDHMHAAYRGTNLVGSKFRFVGEDVTTGEATRGA